MERPWILSNSPMISGGLSLKDSAIQVIFDHDMDEESICYTEEELKDIKKDLGIEDENDERLDEILLKTKVRKEITVEGETTVQEVERVCGYIKDDEYFYKNISITDYTDGTNLNKCFNPPVFETKKILFISANLDYLPQDYTKIFVNIDKNFFYNEQISEKETKPITMPKSLKWIYQVSNETDTSDPVVTTAEVKVCTGNFAGKTLPDTCSEPENLIYFTKNMYINLNLVVTDVGTGPSASFEILVTKVKDEKYNPVTETLVQTKENCQLQYTTSQNGGYNKTVSLDYLDHGVYYITIKVHDKANKSGVSENFYFGVDTSADFDKPEEPTAVTLVSSAGSEPNRQYSYKITFTKPTDNSDRQFLVIEKGWDKSKMKLSSGKSNSPVITFYESVFKAKKNYINCWYEDYAGNKSDAVEVKFVQP